MGQVYCFVNISASIVRCHNKR